MDVPACTLPTTARPLRVAEFATLLAGALRAQTRLSPTTLRWRLDPAAEATARDLTTRESACCAFLLFRYALRDAHLDLDIEVPPTYTDVLTALAALAASALPAVSDLPAVLPLPTVSAVPVAPIVSPGPAVPAAPVAPVAPAAPAAPVL